MSKAKGITLHPMKFEDALRRMLKTRPVPSSKNSKLPRASVNRAPLKKKLS